MENPSNSQPNTSGMSPAQHSEGLRNIPRIVWFHWAQGMEAMPMVTRHCLESWKDKNPDWDVRFVDCSNIHEWVEVDRLPIDKLRATSEQVYANAIRLCLLDRHGGVWSDATNWCRTPLSDWLPHQAGGFFAFSNPGPHRPMANWFMASLPGNFIVRTMARRYIDIFRQYGPLRPIGRDLVKDIVARTGGTDIFVSNAFIESNRAYPYFLFHFLFDHFLRHDSLFSGEWNRVAGWSALPPLEPGRAGLGTLLNPVDKEQWIAQDPPMFKLKWREPWPPISGSILAEILAGRL